MNNIQKKIEEAYRMISAASVSGDSVDVMAGARIKLRDAFKLAGDKSALWDAHKLAEAEKEKEKKKGKGEDG